MWWATWAAACRISESRLGLVRLDIVVVYKVVYKVVYEVVVASTSEKKKEILPRGRQKTVDFDVSRGSIVDRDHRWTR